MALWTWTPSQDRLRLTGATRSLGLGPLRAGATAGRDDALDDAEDGLVALASEEIAIRAIIDHEIETYDPYEGEVLVWTR